MDERTWSRHANPASAWSRVLTNPLVYVPVWNRSWRQAVPVALWFTLNPRLFPPPDDDSAWATRSVLGEQRYTADGMLHADLPGALNAASAANFFVALYAAYRHRLPLLLGTGALALGLKLAFLGRMVTLYDRDGKDTPETASSERSGP
jgi:uncharacterized protein (DUF2062 family)